MSKRSINWKKVFKRTGWAILALIAVVNIVILIRGDFYIYKAFANTIMKGRFGPSIDEHDIFYNRTLEAAEPQPWKTHPDYAANNLRQKDLERFESVETVSYVVIRNDSLYFEQYWDGFDRNSITNSFSVAKSVVSILIGIAVDEGLIKNIDEPAGNYVPSFSEDGKEKVTIRYLLTMSSGLDWYESGADPFSDNAEAYYGWDLEGMVNNMELETEPGKVFNYQSGNTQVLAMVLEKATGKNISEYATEKLWKPLGMMSDGLWNLDGEDGMEKAFCCIYATARDYARIGQLFLNGGSWKGERIISNAYVQESVRPADLKDENGDPNKKYGLSWWMDNYEGVPFYYARGILGQYIICVPKYELVVFRAGHQRGDKRDNDHPEDLYWYIEAALTMSGYDR